MRQEVGGKGGCRANDDVTFIIFGKISNNLI